MRRDKVHTMLVDYAEGTLDASQKKLIEEELKDSSELQRDLQLIRDTLTRLHVIEDQEIPSHYFSNFLPRLHEKLERRQGSIFVAVPLWLRRALVPVTAVVLTGTGIGLYYLLQPASSNETMYEIVKEIHRTDLEMEIQYNPLTVPDELFATSVEEAVASALSESDFSKNYLVAEVFALNPLYENAINDGQILIHLNDDEIEMILKRLNSNAVH